MTVAPGTSAQFVSGSTAVVTTAETIIATTKPVSSPYQGALWSVEFAVDFLTGASVTGVTLRIRRDSLTGTAILTTAAIAAAASTQLPRQYVAATDQLTGDVAGQLWVLTVVQAAATGNGSATNAFSRTQQVG